MRTTVVSGYRERLIGHLRNAADRLEAGEDHYRCSTVTERGGASDLVFEVDPALREGRDTHLIVWTNDDLMAGRPEDWIAGESLRPAEGQRVLGVVEETAEPIPAPAERPGEHVFAMVVEELPASTDPKVASAILKRLAREGMLTPGDVVVQDARQLGLGVLVDGHAVEPGSVHLVRPSAGDTVEVPDETLHVRCGRCGTAFAISEADADEACERCGAYALEVVHADAERRAAAGAARAGAREAPDLVSRMIDARDCLRTVGPVPVAADRAAVEGARRWLQEGIEEGMVQRELYGALRLLVGGETHVCTCGETAEGAGDGCSSGFEDRCRFERALRTLLGVEEGGIPELREGRFVPVGKDAPAAALAWRRLIDDADGRMGTGEWAFVADEQDPHDWRIETPGFVIRVVVP